MLRTQIHRTGSARDSATVALRIASYRSKAGGYLLRLDATGEELADTFHGSVEAAGAPTAFELQTKPEDWPDAGAV